jgi:hypothetical protein
VNISRCKINGEKCECGSYLIEAQLLRTKLRENESGAQKSEIICLH